MTSFFPLRLMEQEEIQSRINAFLKDLGIPSFIVFGWKKDEKDFGIIWSQHQVPPKVAIKGLSWALNDVISKQI